MSSLIVPPILTSPRDDAIKLHGWGCDTAVVIDILAHRDAIQRALIQQDYRAMYSEDLCKRLSSELSGKLEMAVLLWMHDPAGRDAVVMRNSLTTGSLKAATEVICSRTPSQIQLIRQHYHSKFGVHLEDDIKRHTSGDHEKLLLAYVSPPWNEGLEVDRQMVENDAKALYKAGEKRLGTDERTFIRIFCERSRAHLAYVAPVYHSMHGNSLKKVVKKETSGNFEYGLLTILKCSENPAKYFAKNDEKPDSTSQVLHNAMKGLGTDDTTLVRVIVTRTEIDMQYIKAEYSKKYKKTLTDAVHSETSGNYRTFLLSLLGPKY
ncbi:Annexin [Citrus sinensis]|uniref:Annexin n=1 Tax=Citrus sinensis TaxID=2711 RepID=A0ACB8M4N6_CITSI|nr:Annexin [Citrus sinensis]